MPPHQLETDREEHTPALSVHAWFPYNVRQQVGKLSIYGTVTPVGSVIAHRSYKFHAFAPEGKPKFEQDYEIGVRCFSSVYALLVIACLAKPKAEREAEDLCARSIAQLEN